MTTNKTFAINEHTSIAREWYEEVLRLGSVAKEGDVREECKSILSYGKRVMENASTAVALWATIDAGRPHQGREIQDLVYMITVTNKISQEAWNLFQELEAQKAGKEGKDHECPHCLQLMKTAEDELRCPSGCFEVEI